MFILILNASKDDQSKVGACTFDAKQNAPTLSLLPWGHSSSRSGQHLRASLACMANQ
jgi:hypothetical protein